MELDLNLMELDLNLICGVWALLKTLERFQKKKCLSEKGKTKPIKL